MQRAGTPTVLVVGAGHAGLEAAFAASRVGARVRVVTGSLATIGQTPCNPSIGGVAKGHLVREIHALGGFMGRAADATAVHGRVLNQSKGPAVWSTRLQVDKVRYGAYARAAMTSHPDVEVIEGLVVAFDVSKGKVRGVVVEDGTTIGADAVVVTTGTFLGGLLHTGEQATPGGRFGEKPATALSAHLRDLGFQLQRLKTGTPPRLRSRTIDYARMEAQGSDDPFPRFCQPDEPRAPEGLPRLHCHLTWTNPRVHELIVDALDRSPMYSGKIQGVGPRYCPSIEDKVVRFADKSRHQIFVEPEGHDTELVYPNGISTSLPLDVQREFVRAIAGLENAEIVRAGYAVEYDAIDARALDHRLHAREIEGLAFAGQINGTSGYEEAGVQGLIAGANAALAALGGDPLVLERHEAYAGVLVDDLVTQGCDEPYRMMTSRAEYRLTLREDNADARLAERAHASGLVDDARHRVERERLETVAAVEGRLAAGHEVVDVPEWIVNKAKARRVYAGYLERQAREIERLRGESGEGLPLAAQTDYFAIEGLTRECAERLDRVRPTTTGQAARIPGLTPAALVRLWAHARSRARTESP